MPFQRVPLRCKSHHSLDRLDAFAAGKTLLPPFFGALGGSPFLSGSERKGRNLLPLILFRICHNWQFSLVLSVNDLWPWHDILFFFHCCWKKPRKYFSKRQPMIVLKKCIISKLVQTITRFFQISQGFRNSNQILAALLTLWPNFSN